MQEKSLLMNSRLLTVLFIGFASGLPLALTSSTLQAWFTQENISLVAIGSLSLLGIPYSFKFLWAPLMDQFSIPFLGKRKGWIILMQIFAAASIFALAAFEPHTDAAKMYVLAFILVCFSASQDIAIDAYRTDMLLAQERGLGAAYFVFAYRMAMLVAGGFSLVCADYFGWALTYNIMGLLILLSIIPTYLGPQTVNIVEKTNLLDTVRDALLDLLQRERIVLLLLFILFYKIGDALALSLMTNFLLHGLGFTLTEVGLAFKIVSFIATILGGFTAGLMMVRWNLFRALLIFGIAQAFSNLMFVLLAIVGKNFTVMTSSIFIENFCSGMSTAAFFAFLMSLCNKKFTATQYALFTAIASVGRVFLGPIAAMMVDHMGWMQFYIWSFFLCFPGLLFLMLLKNKVVAYASATA